MKQAALIFWRLAFIYSIALIFYSAIGSGSKYFKYDRIA
jgi:hypothetical protein